MSNNSDIMKIVGGILLLFLIASGGVFIHYGGRIKDNKINTDDKKAGQFMIALGGMGLLANMIISILLGYKWKKSNISEKLLQIIVILFTLASNVISIIYGLKINNNNITDDDMHIGEYIITLGSLCVILGTIGLGGIGYLVYKDKKNR